MFQKTDSVAIFVCLFVCLSPSAGTRNRADQKLLVQESIAEITTLRNPFIESLDKFFGVSILLSLEVLQKYIYFLANQPSVNSGRVSRAVAVAVGVGHM